MQHFSCTRRAPAVAAAGSVQWTGDELLLRAPRCAHDMRSRHALTTCAPFSDDPSRVPKPLPARPAAGARRRCRRTPQPQGGCRRAGAMRCGGRAEAITSPVGDAAGVTRMYQSGSTRVRLGRGDSGGTRPNPRSRVTACERLQDNNGLFRRHHSGKINYTTLHIGHLHGRDAVTHFERSRLLGRSDCRSHWLCPFRPSCDGTRRLPDMFMG